MTHYICTGGCGGVSDTPGVCQDEKCPKHGKPLEECGCNEEVHMRELKKSDEREKKANQK